MAQPREEAHRDRAEPDYHPYVFRDGKFVGEFEPMYRAGSDPWHQDSWAYELKCDLILSLLKCEKHGAATCIELLWYLWRDGGVRP